MNANPLSDELETIRRELACRRAQLADQQQARARELALKLEDARQVRDEVAEDLYQANAAIGFLRAELRVLTRPASGLLASWYRFVTGGLTMKRAIG